MPSPQNYKPFSTNNNTNATIQIIIDFTTSFIVKLKSQIFCISPEYPLRIIALYILSVCSKLLTSIEATRFAEVLKERNPVLSFFLSLSITGLGQIYNGEISKGFAFFLIRTALIMFIPIFVITKPETNHTLKLLMTFLFLFIVILFSAIEASLS